MIASPPPPTQVHVNAAADLGFGAVFTYVVGPPPADFFSRQGRPQYAPCSVIDRADGLRGFLRDVEVDFLAADRARREREAARLANYWDSALRVARERGLRPNRSRSVSYSEEMPVVYAR